METSFLLLPFLKFTFKVTITMMAIMNPFYVIPSFLSITSDQSEAERKETARRTVKYAFWILMLFLVGGEVIFYIFGLTVGAFQMAGGVLLLLIGLNMIFEQPGARKEKREFWEEEAESRDNVALVPLAIPLLAGPGTITTVLMLKASAPVWYYQAGVFFAISVACLTVYAVYSSSRHLYRSLGRVGINAITKIMGLILVAVAVQSGVNGIRLLFPGV